MTHSNHSRSRIARLESLEARLVLSAQPLAIIDGASMVDDAVFETEWRASVDELDRYAPTSIDAIRDSYGLTGKHQTVAVIDTGVAWDHYTLGRGFGADYRVVGGWDFAENDANPYDDGPAGFHGTHVAGIIAGSDSARSGVASDVDVVALRVFDDLGNSSFEWVEQALRWVHDHRDAFENPITTVNLSIGTHWNRDSVPNWSQLEDELETLADDGIFIAAAAGNRFMDFESPGLSYPAASPFVVPVASVDGDGHLSDFSQRNNRVLAAPGEAIESAIPNHLYGSQQPSDRFLALSGTSMATPYVAGASVLVREAMQFQGMENVDQATLYEHFRLTSDEIWDSSTQSNYLRLNLHRALDALMQDSVGDSTGTATSIGNLSGSTSIAGTIERTQDRDAYSFVALADGDITMTVESTHALNPDWTLPDKADITDRGAVSFEVRAGQRYDFAIGTNAGIGHYEIDVAFAGATAPIVRDLGTIDQLDLSSTQLNDSRLFKVTASRTGLFAAQVRSASENTEVEFELLDAGFSRLAVQPHHATSTTLIASVQAGEQLYLRISGDIDVETIRLQNLIGRFEQTVDIAGTAADDSYQIAIAAVPSVTLNGIEYHFDPAQVSTYRVHASAGIDQFAAELSDGNDVVRSAGDAVDILANDTRIFVDSVEDIHIDGRGGADKLVVADTLGDDQYHVRDSQVFRQVDDDSLQAIGFEDIRVHGGAGADTIEMFAGSGGARFIGWADKSFLISDDARVVAKGIDHVQVVAGSDGLQRATLNGSELADHFTSVDAQVTMRSATSGTEVSGFSVVVLNGHGGDDTANVAYRDSDRIDSNHRSTVLHQDHQQLVLRSVEDPTYSRVSVSSALAWDTADARSDSSLESLAVAIQSHRLQYVVAPHAGPDHQHSIVDRVILENATSPLGISLEDTGLDRLGEQMHHAAHDSAQRTNAKATTESSSRADSGLSSDTMHLIDRAMFQLSDDDHAFGEELEPINDATPTHFIRATLSQLEHLDGFFESISKFDQTDDAATS